MIVTVGFVREPRPRVRKKNYSHTSAVACQFVASRFSFRVAHDSRTLKKGREIRRRTGGESVHRVYRDDFATARNPPWCFKGRLRVTLSPILLCRSVLAILRFSIACGCRKNKNQRNHQRTTA